ncbi:hypothetical protein TcG_10536 [Trypanosoma cruzi]|nr:hypothetical protein TcG_10536 [Trypanosoma cruzi]
MNGCRQEALTINMSREHAATPHAGTQEERITGEKSKQQKHTRKKQIAGGKSIAKGFTLAGNSTPALTNTHHRSAASPRVRGFGPPHNKLTHRQQSHQCTRRSDTPPSPPVQSHGQRDTATALQPTPSTASNHPKSHSQRQFRIHP